ncbi:ankyrin repeat domain-containing protein 11-like isoform X4 [Mytilus californianus]|uniref:ankyrin repeat domain-containing protein 11-like isoform X4 n=1 Tax=Mytilus californianus TaxID=6549 RepID=UPI002247EF70|nr:ankyrin repeat domain-containing protein 11-like isoform X4 [Mytilus californianus]
MVLGLSDRIPEEDETKSHDEKRDEETKENEHQPKYTKKELKDKLWKTVGEGHSDSLTKLLNEVKDFQNLEELLNEENADFDEDGNNLLLYCIKEGCDSGPSIGRHFHKCAEILIANNVNINHMNKAGHTPLFEAVFYKNTNYITTLLNHKAEADRFDQDGIDPLHLAIHLGYKDCFNLLVQHEEKEIFNRKDGKGTPPLVAAVQHGHIDICHLLIDGGCDINAYDSKLQRNALHYAVIAKRFDLFELLLKHKPNLDHCDHKGRTIFHRVCAIQEPKYLKKLFHSGFNITTSLMDQETDDGLTPVIISCQNGNAEQLKELLENGASVKTTDKTGKNALHYCADNLETQCAEMLLMREESLIHVQDEQGFTPLHMAVIGGNVPLLKLLVRKGADVDILDADGHTPSHWATGNHLDGVKVCTHLEILDVLIEQDAELSKCDNHNAYPIHYAAQMNGRDNGHSDAKIGEKVLKKLLDSGIPCDVLDKDRRQPLLWAASAGNSESCKLLVTAGADVNSTDKDGLTALHCAASRGHSECVDKLKKLGAEVNVADTNGCTALFYAITLGNKDCTRLLLKYGADPNHKDTRGRTPTHCAAIKGCLETVKMLDKSKADLWHASFRGDCPIHEAAQGGHCDVVKYLLKWKNSPDAVNIANDAGRTCLHIAAIVNNLQLCKLLLDSEADKNALMKNKTNKDGETEDKSYTPYDAAIIKGNNEIAEYIKSKGGVTGGDIDNILIAKGKKRDTKSGNSRKSVPTLETTPEETEPDDNKKAEEEAEKEKEEEDKKEQEAEEDKKKQKSEVDKKKDKGKKKEKVEKEREKEKLVIVPIGKQKKKEKDEKGKEDQKESEKEKAETDQEGKGEKKDLTDEELRELQEKIKAGESEVDERDIKRKPIKEIEGKKTEGEQQKKDNKLKDKDKKKDLTEEELEEAKRKIQAGQGDLDERERKQKEAEQKEAEKEKSSKKEGEQETKGKKKDLSDEELKALQEKIKAEQGDNDQRGKHKKTKKEDGEKNKGGKQKPDLTDAEVAAVTAAVIVATEEDKNRDKEKEKLKTKEKDQDKLKVKDQGKGKDTLKSADQEKERKKEQDREELDIPPPSTSPDLREPKQKEKSAVDKGQKDKKKQIEESKKKQEKDQKDKKKLSDEIESEERKKKQIESEERERKKKQIESEERERKKKQIESEERKKRQEKDQKDKKKQSEKSKNKLSDESDSEEEKSKKKQVDELDSEENKKKQEKDKKVHIVPKRAFVESATASESEKSRRDSPVKYRQRSRSRSTDNEEFEFPEGAHETTEAAIAAAEARRKARERSRSRSTDRESDEKPADIRRYSKVGTDGRIQPGLLADKDKRNRRPDERDIPSPLDSEDEFIDDPYFGRRVKPYPGSVRIGSKRPDNREQVLREKEFNRKRQQEMSHSSQRMPSKGGVARMLPLGYSRLETPQRPITRKSNSIQESVRRYQTERTFVRQLHQLKRAQIYTGPMHDIVLFSKMMNVYNNTSNYDNELDLDSQVLDDWDGYLQDQLRFVSHYYEDDRTGLRDTAKEYHQKLEKSATNAKKTVESRIDHIIKQNEKQEVEEREEQEKLDKKISHLAEKTESVLDSVRQQANDSVTSARNLNSSLEEEFRRERQDRLKNYRYGNNREKSWLLEQEAMDSRQSRMDEHEKERKAKHKEWMRKKDEESRRKLMRVYGPTPVFDTSLSKRGAPFKTSTPKLLNNSSRASPRPKSMASSMSTSRSRPQDQELEVHMTEFGMRRVKTEDCSFANWTPKYDGINLRPRAGLVFVEPTVYDEVLKEERLIRGGQTRNSTRNLTLETDKMLETVES